jgi:predicted nucleic acid-binding protein
MPLVVDASVAVKWLVKEEGSDRAEAPKAEDLLGPMT